MTIAIQKIPPGLFAKLGYKKEDSPELTLEQKQYVINCIRTFYENR